MKSTAVRLALGGLLSLAAGIGIGRFVYTPILPVMVEGLGLSQGEAGLIASANFLGYLVGALAAAAPKLPGARRAWLLGGLLANAVAMAVLPLTTALGVFLALRFFAGVASAFILVFASAIVLDGLAQRQRGDLAALHFAGVGAGIALSAALVALLLAQGADWKELWLASAGLALIAALAVTRLVPPADKTPHAATRPADAPRPKGLPILVLAYGLFGFGYVITATFIVAIVRGAPALAELESTIWIVVGLAGAPSILFWNWIAKHTGLLRAFAIASLAEALGVAASVLWTSIPALLLAAVLLGGTFMGITALGLVAARQLARADPRPALAGMTAAFGIGQIVGPALAGFAHDATGSFLGASLAAAAALIAAAALVMLIRLPAEKSAARADGTTS